MKDNLKYYSVGPLLYCPANKEKIADYLIEEKFGAHYSLALCLEDTIADGYVIDAQRTLSASLKKVYQTRLIKDFFLPKIFIRVRSAGQIMDLLRDLGDAKDVVYGFIIPKFNLDTADDYIEKMKEANEYASSHPFYMMPIFEDHRLLDSRLRTESIYGLKDKISCIEDLILNIRVGGNDLCNNLGLRRSFNQSIHDIGPVANILYEVLLAYGSDYVVSGPVFEYYGGDEGWKDGLKAEAVQDRLCGFVGKTVIHPNQIDIVNSAYRVSMQDYMDARSILSWKMDTKDAVIGSHNGSRMNEYKTHSAWAMRTLYLAMHYGVLNEKNFVYRPVYLGNHTSALQNGGSVHDIVDIKVTDIRKVG